MKKGIFILLFLTMLFTLAGCGAAAPQTQTGQSAENTQTATETKSREPDPSVSGSGENTENDTLVVYFSATGTTKLLAEYAADILNADLYEIVPETPYTEADLDYYTGGRADQEQGDPNARPAISGNVENMEKYGTVVLGYPIWHGQAPRIISTFLESYDFSGKTMIPFCTSHSSGIGSSADDLRSLCSEQTTWIRGRRFEAGTSMDIMRQWLNGI